MSTINDLLRIVIDAVYCPVGEFDIEEDEYCYRLIWTALRAELPPNFDDDDPWALFGGNAILQTLSAVVNTANSGIDSYWDASGTHKVCYWVELYPKTYTVTVTDVDTPSLDITLTEYINTPDGEPPVPSQERADEILNSVPAMYLID
jgi:hypothetical protein